jgi:hypothetical protein
MDWLLRQWLMDDRLLDWPGESGPRRRPKSAVATGIGSQLNTENRATSKPENGHQVNTENQPACEPAISAKPRPNVSKRARELLRAQLADGPRPASQIEAAAEAAEIPERTLIAAASALRVRTQRGQWWIPSGSLFRG